MLVQMIKGRLVSILQQMHQLTFIKIRLDHKEDLRSKCYANYYAMLPGRRAGSWPMAFLS
jgi:hypothetical protein